MGAVTENETMVRKAYKIADEQDVPVCVPQGGRYSCQDLCDRLLRHAQDLQNVYVTADDVVVELTLNGTNTGPFESSQCFDSALR